MMDPDHEHLFHPIMFHFGGVKTDNKGIVTEAGAMKLMFMVDDSSALMRKASLMFLGALHTYLLQSCSAEHNHDHSIFTD